jgi:tRNA threonylcarbamoyladenosine biosynthesis protein TsaE
VGVFWTGSEAETRALGERFGARLQGGEIVLLCGDLGAGKTQFAKGVGRGLGVAAEVVSPTFTLAVHYAGRLPLAHYDLYRVQRQAELLEIGFLEPDDPRTVTLVEWGDRLPPPPGAVRVVFHLEGGERRRIEITGCELDPTP